MADSIGCLPVTAAVEQEGPGATAPAMRSGRHFRSMWRASSTSRAATGPALCRQPRRRPGAGRAPPDEPNRYLPGGYPGTRAPHVATGPDRSLLDDFGRDFTLLAFSPDGPDGLEPWRQAAAQYGIRLDVVMSEDGQTRALYGADRVLIRPDHHIAWRGDGAAQPTEVMALALGHRTPPVGPG